MLRKHYQQLIQVMHSALIVVTFRNRNLEINQKQTLVKKIAET